METTLSTAPESWRTVTFDMIIYPISHVKRKVDSSSPHDDIKPRPVVQDVSAFGACAADANLSAGGGEVASSWWPGSPALRPQTSSGWRAAGLAGDPRGPSKAGDHRDNDQPDQKPGPQRCHSHR
jgi:hypothetical protein